MEVKYTVYEPVERRDIIDLHDFLRYVEEEIVDGYDPSMVHAYFMSWLVDSHPNMSFEQVNYLRMAINMDDVEKEINRILEEDE